MIDTPVQQIHTELMARIHRIQRQLADLQGRLRRMPQIQKVQDTHRQELTDQLQKCRETSQQLQREAKAKENSLASSEQALAKRKLQLSEAKTNKEYLALKQQIEADSAANSVLADEALESIDKSESFFPRVSEAEAELQKTVDLLHATRKQHDLEIPVIEVDIARCAGQLAEAEQELPHDFREMYKRLVSTQPGGEALALINNQKYCGNCNQLVAINNIAQVIQRKPIPCQSCGRLLYVEEGYKFDKG